MQNGRAGASLSSSILHFAFLIFHYDTSMAESTSITFIKGGRNIARPLLFIMDWRRSSSQSARGTR
jgi:hypothetical protein